MEQLKIAQDSGAFDRYEARWNGTSNKTQDIFIIGISQGKHYLLASCNTNGVAPKTVEDVRNEVCRNAEHQKPTVLGSIGFVGISAISLTSIAIIVETSALSIVSFRPISYLHQDMLVWLMFSTVLGILINSARLELKRKNSSYHSILKIIKSEQG